MSLVDANVILRYILDDHPELSTTAATIIEQQTVTLPIEVACEVVFVLQKVYAVDPKRYADLQAGKGETAGVHIGCSVVGELDGMFVHDCDTNSGASGSALCSTPCGWTEVADR